jgi:hypothetical protein
MGMDRTFKDIVFDTEIFLDNVGIFGKVVLQF